MNTTSLQLPKFEADFGFDAPRRTAKPCSNPVFADAHYHRIAVMKDFHVGAPGDVDESGLPGWISKSVCTGCGRIFKDKAFYPDNSTIK